MSEGRQVGKASQASDVLVESVAESSPAEPPSATTLAVDDWEWDEQLRHIGRMLQSRRTLATLEREALLSFDLPAPLPCLAETVSPPRAAAESPSAVAPASPQSLSPNRPRAERAARSTALFSLLAGCTVFSCGAVLMVYSWLMARPELWNPGLIAAIFGQFAVCWGLTQRLETPQGPS